MEKGIKQRVITKKETSATPYYVGAAVWFSGCLFLPMFRLSSYLILAVIDAVAIIYCKKKCDRVVEEVVEEFETPLLKETITEARKMIEQLKEVNTRIENQKISDQIDRFITITQKAMDSMIENPAKIDHFRKFIYFYLPQCVQLLDQYDKLCDGNNTSVKSEAETKISGVLDLMEQAFNKLNDDQYEYEMMELNADISVVEKMLQQNGINNK